MERPQQLPTLGQPPALSISATSVPGSVSASATIYVSPEAAGHEQNQLRQPHHQAAQPDLANAPPRRGSKRTARGETGVAEESTGVWGANSGLPAKTNGESRNGNGPSSGLGTSPEGQDSSTASPTATAEQPKKKQKRNKPTLSCFECVERKTKVRRHFSRIPGLLGFPQATPPRKLNRASLFPTHAHDDDIRPFLAFCIPLVIVPLLLFCAMPQVSLGRQRAEDSVVRVHSRTCFTDDICWVQCDRGRPHCLACMSSACFVATEQLLTSFQASNGRQIVNMPMLRTFLSRYSSSIARAAT